MKNDNGSPQESPSSNYVFMFCGDLGDVSEPRDIIGTRLPARRTSLGPLFRSWNEKNFSKLVGGRATRAGFLPLE